MFRLLFFLLFSFFSFSQINEESSNLGCFDDNYTIEVGMSLYDPSITNCVDAITYLNNYGYGCNTYLSDINNPFWGANPNETIANICGCTCEESVIEILGCLDPIACNYNISANIDDGSCIFPVDCESCSGEINGTGTVIDNDLDDDGICDDDCEDFQYMIIDCECSFLDPATYTIFFTNVDEVNCLIIDDCYCECINDFDGDGICDENEQQGCTDPVACNYDASIALEGIDDGSCVFPGDECIAGIVEGGELIYGTYNEDCICVDNNSAIEESKSIKKLIKTVDLIGRNIIMNGFMIKIYDDGTVERGYFNIKNNF